MVEQTAERAAGRVVSNHRGGASGRRGYDPAKGAQDVEDLGGFTDEHRRLVDSLATDLARRRLLVNWYGSHGGRWAWEQWCASRNRV